MQFNIDHHSPHMETALLESLNKRFPNANLKLELDTTDNVMHVHGIPEDTETAAKVEAAIEETGFRGSWVKRQ